MMTNSQRDHVWKTIRDIFTPTLETSENILVFSNRYTISTRQFRAEFDLLIKEKN